MVTVVGSCGCWLSKRSLGVTGEVSEVLSEQSSVGEGSAPLLQVLLVY